MPKPTKEETFVMNGKRLINKTWEKLGRNKAEFTNLYYKDYAFRICIGTDYTDVTRGDIENCLSGANTIQCSKQKLLKKLEDFADYIEKSK